MKIKIKKVLSEQEWNKDSKTPRDYSKEYNKPGSKEQEERNKRKRDKRKHDKEHGNCPEGEELHHVNGIEGDDLQCEPVSKNRGRKEKSRLKDGEIVIKIKKSSCGELNEIEQSAPSPQQIKLVQGLLKNILVVAQASEDAQTPVEEGSAVRKGRIAKKHRRWRTQEIKKIAGLAGIKLKDFTPEQKNLYADAKKEMASMEEDGQLQLVTDLYRGDLGKLPFIKDLRRAGGRPLKHAISLVAGEECAESLDMHCLVKALLQFAQYGE